MVTVAVLDVWLRVTLTPPLLIKSWHYARRMQKDTRWLVCMSPSSLKDSWKMLWGKKQWNYKQICHKTYIFTDLVTHYLFFPPCLQLLEPFFNQKRCSSSRHWDRKRDLHQSRSKVKLASVVHHTSVKPWGIFIVFDVKNTRYRNSYYCIIVEKHYSLLIFTNLFYPNQ